MSKRIQELENLGWDANAIAELLDELKHELDSSNEATTIRSKETPSLEIRVTRLLKKIGMPFNVKGKSYISAAVIYFIENEKTTAEVSMTKELYPYVAKQFGTTVPRAERAIRHCCEETFDNGSPELEAVFGNSINLATGKLTNSQFIAMLVDYINLGEDLR